MSATDRRRHCRRGSEPTEPEAPAAAPAGGAPPGLPDVFTVEEAARYLRIGRASAYELARRFRETDGREGLPVVVLGRSLRVPRHALEQLLLVSVPADSADPSGRNGRGRT
ncbi:hypothetical protein BH18ACT1_BH18ACT1_09380 [soil metagenome]